MRDFYFFFFCNKHTFDNKHHIKGIQSRTNISRYITQQALKKMHYIKDMQVASRQQQQERQTQAVRKNRQNKTAAEEYNP